jgi:hypothetical protein
MKPLNLMFSLPPLAFMLAGLIGSVQAQSPLDRTVLPISDPVYEPITELDARNAKAPPPFSINAPENAPNVVIVLIDDIGFGTAGVFGGGIETPTLDRLAQEGLRDSGCVRRWH